MYSILIYIYMCVQIFNTTLPFCLYVQTYTDDIPNETNMTKPQQLQTKNSTTNPVRLQPPTKPFQRPRLVFFWRTHCSFP